MIVYGSSLSPFVRKVLVIAAEKGVEVENRVAGPGSPPAPDFLQASPFAKIPAIRDGDFTLSDSTAIALYLEAKHPEPVLIPAEAQARGRVMWFDEFADTIGFATGAKIFWNRVVAKLIGQPSDEAAADKAERDELPAHLDYLESVVPESGWLVGDGFTLADISVGSIFVNHQHAAVKVEVEKHPRLKAYIARVHARPSFAPQIARETGFLAKARGG